MQILDLSQLILSAIFGSKYEINIDNLRGMMLAMVRNSNFRFRLKYGEMIIAADGETPYWRTDIFPYYKANRKKLREKSNIDWKLVYEVTSQFKEELKEYFPYKFIEIPRVEADDIIAVLTINRTEPIMIVSSDKDYLQLHDEDVQQYNPVQDRYVSTESPEEYLLNHILRGDSGDGIPNVLSDSDTFMVEGKHQKKLGSKQFAIIADNYQRNYIPNEEINRNLMRNESLIDLKRIPDFIVTDILQNFTTQEKRTRLKMRKYFAQHNLPNFMRSLGEF